MSDKRVRPEWDEYFINLLDKLGDRVSCTRGKCAAIFTIDNRLISTGYAGAPSGMPHCIDEGIGDQLEERIQFLDPSIEFFNIPLHEEIVLNSVKYSWSKRNNRYESEKKIFCIRTNDSILNAIYTSAKHGISLNNSTLYTSIIPERESVLAIISVGTKRVVCEKNDNKKTESQYLFAKAGIELVILNLN